MFWDNVNKQGPVYKALGPCWIWKGWVDKDGYGKTSHKGVSYTTHRLSWILAHGDVPNSLWVLHRCDNPSCVNPTHLFLGNAKDNSQDMVSKGRNFQTRPWFRKLTFADAQDIRKKKVNGASFRQLATEYEVAVCCIQNIVNNNTYLQEV